MSPRFYFPFIIIMNKLMRILTSPDNPDHWRDIAGYATLVLQDLEESNNGEVHSSTARRD